MSNYYDVVIATPGEVFDQHYVWSLINTVQYLERNNITWIWLNDYSSHVGEVRQRLVDQALELSYNKLFWIDSDVEWLVEDFIKLYESDHSIISGCYITTAFKVAAQNFNGSLIDPESIYLSNDIREVRSCGFGFLCLKYGVIESIDNPFIPIGPELNEDIAFCARAKNEINLPTMLDTSIKLMHYRTLPLGWNTI